MRIGLKHESEATHDIEYFPNLPRRDAKRLSAVRGARRALPTQLAEDLP